MIRRVAAWPSGRVAKWVILAFWIAVFVGLGPLAGKVNSVQKNDMSAWLPKNAESTKVLEQSEKFQPSDTMPTIVVYDRAAGTTPADLDKAKADAAAFKGVKDVLPDVQGPIPSKDGKAIQTVVNVKLGDDGWEGATKAVDKLIDIGEKGGNGLGLHVTGPGGYAADSGKIFSGGDNTLMFATVGVVILILLITYRSPILWLLPILTAGIALTASQAVVYLLAKHGGLTVNAQSGFILTVLVFGAATDYALLLIARYREELRRHEDRHEAMAEALHRSSPAIIASAATVAIGLMVLIFAELNSTKGLGPVCAIGIVVGLLAMITLLPALLVIFGRWMFWPVRPTYGSAEPTEDGLWSRVGRRIAVRPRMVWLVTAVVLAALGLGIFALKADGIQNKDSFTKTTQAITGEEIHARHFPAGDGQPLSILTKADSADQVRAALTGVPGIGQVGQPVVKDGQALVSATLKDAADSPAAMDTIRDARKAVHDIDGAGARVGGGTAINLDMQDAASRDSMIIIPIVLLVVFLILAALLRSVLAPLLLMLTVVLSFVATLGISSLAFEHVFGFAGADASFPLMSFVFLVALGIDYNIFLVTRVREEAERYGTRRGALIGLSATGGVITSAGLVLAGTFAALGAMPMVFAAELGFAVAFGVLLDTIIVRSVLVTALTLDVGRWMWWPSKLVNRRDDDAPPEPPAGQADPEPAFAGK